MEKNFTLPDITLIKSCINGDRKSQKKLYELIAPKMYAICLRFFNRGSEAEDVLQEGFIKLFNNLHSYRGDGPFEGWVRRIFVNVAIEISRRRKLDTYCISDFHNSFIVDESSVLSGLYEKDIQQIKNELSDGYKTVFNLYAVEGYSHKEIGELLGISENTSKSQYSRAKASLREEIGKRA